jgi:hypothetical protein
VLNRQGIAAGEQYQQSKKNESQALIHIDPNSEFYFMSLMDSIPALAATAFGSAGFENS